MFSESTLEVKLWFMSLNPVSSVENDSEVKLHFVLSIF